MESKKTSMKSHSDSPLICRVCGDTARGLNFDVITCMSCKAFFRRHALRGSTELSQCQFDDDCVITQTTRGYCSACRLKKCFALGMNPQLIRSSPQKSTSTTNRQQITTNPMEETWSPQPTTVSLLNKDRSTLTFDEWNLLSNIIHAYDELDLVTRTQCTLREQSSLPPKLRSKPSYTLDIIGSFYKFVKPFLEHFPQFSTLSTNLRQLILHNNLRGTGALNSMFAANETKVMENEFYSATCHKIYGEAFIKDGQRLLSRIESNGTLLKLILVTLGFSSNCSLVLFDHRYHFSKTSSTNSIILMHIQDIFIVLLWKYLVYQFGFIEAVRRLDNLVRFYLHLLNHLNDINSQQHMEMIETLIEKTTQTLNIS